MALPFPGTRNLVYTSLFAALTALGAFIRVPLPFIPFTLQFLFCALAGFLLGPRWGTLSQILYVGIGLLGIPIFTAGGGPGYVFQPTFGYLLGFIGAAWLIGVLRDLSGNLTFTKLYGITLLGLGVVYLLGVPWLYGIFRFYLREPHTVQWALFYGLWAPLGGDLALSILVALTVQRVLRADRGLFYSFRKSSLKRRPW